jgi:hypothetical protein
MESSKIKELFWHKHFPILKTLMFNGKMFVPIFLFNLRNLSFEPSLRLKKTKGKSNKWGLSS